MTIRADVINDPKLTTRAKNAIQNFARDHILDSREEFAAYLSDSQERWDLLARSRGVGPLTMGVIISWVRPGCYPTLDRCVQDMIAAPITSHDRAKATWWIREYVHHDLPDHFGFPKFRSES